jgi:pimeloyl-ACP methyl ester carboxylesterase
MTGRQWSAMPTGPEFHRAFANKLDFSESEALRARHAVAAARSRSAGIHETGIRGPLLLISGGCDLLAPEERVNDLHIWHRRKSPDAVTDYQVFPGHGHSMVIDGGWRDIAECVLDWLTRQNQ